MDAMTMVGAGATAVVVAGLLGRQYALGVDAGRQLAVGKDEVALDRLEEDEAVTYMGLGALSVIAGGSAAGVARATHLGPGRWLGVGAAGLASVAVGAMAVNSMGRDVGMGTG